MTSRPVTSARKVLALLELSLIFGACVTATATAGAGLPVPVPPLPVTLPGGGGGPGGGGPGGGGPGGGGPVGVGSGAAPSSVGLQLSGNGFSDFHSSNLGPNDRFGDPLSTDLLGSDRIHARLRYYGESGAVGTTQAVGLNLTFAQ